MITFGIWPGVVSSDLERFDTFVAAPAEDPPRAVAALRELAGDADRYYVRCYRGYGGGAQPPAPLSPRPYLSDNRVVDLVLCYASEEADPDGYAQAVRAAVAEVAALGGGKLQVCEEVNVPAPQDGGRPGCYEALAAGLAAALDERDRLGVEVRIGFNAAVAFPDDPFWSNLRARVDARVLSRIDYLGLDFFPGVFRPMPLSNVPQAVGHVLNCFRESATDIGIPSSVPIHITETGWPTGPDHTEDEQSRVISTVAETVMALAGECHIDTYEFFGLRDGLSSGPRMNRFGLLRDDHTPKPAFEAVKHLVARYGAASR